MAPTLTHALLAAACALLVVAPAGATASPIAPLFVDTSELVDNGFGTFQILFLILVYGYILYLSAKLIADGSELLSVVLDPGLVGGLLLPIMGAVPDAAIVLFSGLGDDAQLQLKVGVGTLAGSTIMLLTVPWLACAWVGRVDIKVRETAGSGDSPAGPYCNYQPTGKGAQKLTPGLSWTDTFLRTGVQPPATIKGAARICILSAVSYVIIQGPAFALHNVSPQEAEAHFESPWALAGLIVSGLLLAIFSAYCVLSANAIEQQKARQNEARKHAVGLRLVSLLTLIEIADKVAETEAAAVALTAASAARIAAGGAAPVPANAGETILHIVQSVAGAAAGALEVAATGHTHRPGAEGVAAGGGVPSSETHASTRVLRALFNKYDLDGNGELDRQEVRLMLAQLDIKVDNGALKQLMADFGGDDNLIQFHKFEALMHKFAHDRATVGSAAFGAAASAAITAASRAHEEGRRNSVVITSAAGVVAPNAIELMEGGAVPRPMAPLPPSQTVTGDEIVQAAVSLAEEAAAVEEKEEEENDDDESEEEADELSNSTPRQIVMRALGILSLGVGLCVVFSDPMVDALTELGNRWTISPFYISFVITPIVSNASELLSSLQFSARKTRRSIDMTYQQLLGAATMNVRLAHARILALYPTLTFLLSHSSPRRTRCASASSSCSSTRATWPGPSAPRSSRSSSPSCSWWRSRCRT